MSLPEKNIVHVKKVMVDISKCPCEPKTAPCAMDWCLTSHHWGSCPAQYQVCADNCPACIEDARDTDWAEWTLDILDFDFECNGNSYFRAEFPTADYEALKKLAEGE